MNGGEDNPQATVNFNAVYGNGEANKDWSKWTPSGYMSMVITNPSAFDQFSIGKEFYLDFTPVE
jgi:hypothetical protein